MRATTTLHEAMEATGYCHTPPTTWISPQQSDPNRTHDGTVCCSCPGSIPAQKMSVWFLASCVTVIDARARQAFGPQCGCAGAD